MLAEFCINWLNICNAVHKVERNVRQVVSLELRFDANAKLEMSKVGGTSRTQRGG